MTRALLSCLIVLVLSTFAWAAPPPPPPGYHTVVITYESTRVSSVCYYCPYAVPARVHTWDHDNGNATWDYPPENPLTWTPLQHCWVDGVEWVLQWYGSWWWTHPEDVNIRPFWTTYSTGGYPYQYLGVSYPNGRRFNAHYITMNPYPGGYAEFRASGSGWVCGGTNTGRYFPAYPEVFGTCNISNQAGGGPGMMYGWWRSLPRFRGWTWDNWQHGVFVFGPDPYTLVSDFNANGRVSTQDIYDFLQCYFSAEPRADCDRSGTVNEADLYAFLGSWFSTSTP